MDPDDAQRRIDSGRLPAGLDERDEALERGPGAHPSGARGDHRESPPGTRIPGAPQPLAASEAEPEAEDADGEPRPPAR